MPGLATHLNALPVEEARRTFERCCGAICWVDQMISCRPFSNDAEVFQQAEEIWRSLTPNDWLEAFEQHPRIGDRSASEVSRQEQSGVDRASDDVLWRLEANNRAYEQRFGHVFLICASGRSADEMLAELERRLGNDAESELAIAAGEQAKITRLRLGGIVNE